MQGAHHGIQALLSRLQQVSGTQWSPSLSLSFLTWSVGAETPSPVTHGPATRAKQKDVIQKPSFQ